MRKGIEEDLFDKEIRVEDGNNILKEIFKPDYEKTKELDRATIYMTAEWNWILRLLKKRLRTEGATRQGVHFIRRRLTVAGLQILNKENEKAIAKRQKEYDTDSETYNPFRSIFAAQLINIYPHETTRTSIYLKEDTMGWIHDISTMFNLNIYSVIRVAWGYVILQLVEAHYLPLDFKQYAEADVKLFKQYIVYKE